jgi:hypothetical protein
MNKQPPDLQANIWTGESSPTRKLASDSAWQMPRQPKVLDGRQADTAYSPPPIVDLREWVNPEVGWGLLLPDTKDLDPKSKAVGADASEPLRRLLQERGNAPVLRWSSTVRPGHLVRYYGDGTFHERPVAAPEYGVGTGKIPRYLLIYATPKEIPWAVQYQLNLTNYVGRLTLTGDALKNYVNHLLADWEGEATHRPPVVWSVDEGAQDITGLMARAMGKKLADAFGADTDFWGATRISRSALG